MAVKCSKGHYKANALKMNFWAVNHQCGVDKMAQEGNSGIDQYQWECHLC